MLLDTGFSNVVHAPSPELKLAADDASRPLVLIPLVLDTSRDFQRRKEDAIK